MAFAPGDIVQLKSGSPALTVVTASETEISVVWFAEDVSEFRKEALPAVAVEKLEIADFEEEDEEEDDED
ncbi:YodC family protein [Xanthobacter wiegelii]|uniref:YodC family protein n=1 Tax=Xanthobacter wiegelii TaxID=3119913 RepID=UPI0037261E0A